MIYKLFPISLMTFLAIYLFVFPHYLKPNKELLQQQHFISKRLKQKVEEQREINLRLSSSLRQRIKMRIANSFLTETDKCLQKVIKEALDELKVLSNTNDIEQKLENTNAQIQRIPHGNNFDDYLLELNLSKPKIETNENIGLAKQYVEVELLKMENFYLNEILKIAIGPDYFRPRDYMIRAKFNKPNYEIGEEMVIDLEFYESKLANYTKFDTVTINGEIVDKSDFRNDYLVIHPEKFEQDSICLKYTKYNPVTGASKIYQSKLILN